MAKMGNTTKNVVNNSYNYHISTRISLLKKLKNVLQSNRENIKQALFNDLKKPDFEINFAEFYSILNEIDYFLKNIKKFCKRKSMPVPFHMLNTKAYLSPEPYGHVLIISPWNFPFQLTFLPLIGAIAAGNTVTVKPSEISQHSERLICQIINEAFPSDIVKVVTGGSDIINNLLQERFDLIFFTGSPQKAKYVMRAAVENLTPVILELGGKNPLIIEDVINMEYVAAEACRTKFVNSGQHCQAIDYILVNKQLVNSLKQGLIQKIEQFYGEDPSKSKFYCKIINEDNFNRLVGYLQNANIIYGGKHDNKQSYISPTLVEIQSFDTPLMQDEIFGPILPIFAYDNLDEAIEIVKSYERPLALYMFSTDTEKCERIMGSLPAGGVDINSVGSHFVNWNLPFGGIGYSGMGAYHGKASFDAFTHYKPVSETKWQLYVTLKYPPFFNKDWLFKIFK